MPESHIIISDTGPLIALAKTNNLFILQQLFQQVIIPEAVFQELHLSSYKQGVDLLNHAIHGDKWLEVKKIKHPPKKEISNTLDKGEAEAVTLAKELGKMLLIDEVLGRRVAKHENIRIIGTAGILVLAKKKEIIKSVKNVLHDLQTEGYYLSENLCKEVLKMAGE